MYNLNVGMLAVGMEILEEVRASVQDEAGLEVKANDVLAVIVVLFVYEPVHLPVRPFNA